MVDNKFGNFQASLIDQRRNTFCRRLPRVQAIRRVSRCNSVLLRPGGCRRRRRGTSSVLERQRGRQVPSLRPRKAASSFEGRLAAKSVHPAVPKNSMYISFYKPSQND